MSKTATIYDLLLVITIIAIAWNALFGRNPFSATIFFVAYGLFLALIWVQLGAPDVALAEAGIGAGLTGALMLGAIRQFESDPLLHLRRSFSWSNSCIAVLSALLSAGVVLTIWGQRMFDKSIQALVQENLEISGSSHPVTSVLLNFRAFDTWLEIGVLLLAAISALTIKRVHGEHISMLPPAPCREQTEAISRLLLPLLILIGGVMLWYGARAPGGAFQAGALIGAAGILLQLAGESSVNRLLATSDSRILNVFLVIGFSAFLLVAALSLAIGKKMLEYPWDLAGIIILAIEFAATLSIATILNVMYACSKTGEETTK